MQNTNVKARRLLAGDIQRQMQHPRRAFPEVGRGGDVKGNPDASQVARLKALYEIHTALLELYPNTIKHIDSSSDEEMSAQEKKLAELQEQIQGGLTIASGGDPTSQVEPRAALADMKNALCRPDQDSRAWTPTIARIAISLTESKVTGDECTKRIDELDQLLAKEATAGRDLSEAAYRSGLWWILGVTRRRRGAGRPRRRRRDAVDHPAGLRGPERWRRRWPRATCGSASSSDRRTRSGELSDATNALADSLTRIVTEIQKVSEGLAGSASDLPGCRTSCSRRASMRRSRRPASPARRSNCRRTSARWPPPPRR